MRGQMPTTHASRHWNCITAVFANPERVGPLAGTQSQGRYDISAEEIWASSILLNSAIEKEVCFVPEEGQQTLWACASGSQLP